jgi:hypothetical protein
VIVPAIGWGANDRHRSSACIGSSALSIRLPRGFWKDDRRLTKLRRSTRSPEDWTWAMIGSRAVAPGPTIGWHARPQTQCLAALNNLNAGNCTHDASGFASLVVLRFPCESPLRSILPSAFLPFCLLLLLSSACAEGALHLPVQLSRVRRVASRFSSPLPGNLSHTQAEAIIVFLPHPHSLRHPAAY